MKNLPLFISLSGSHGVNNNISMLLTSTATNCTMIIQKMMFLTERIGFTAVKKLETCQKFGAAFFLAGRFFCTYHFPNEIFQRILGFLFHLSHKLLFPKTLFDKAIQYKPNKDYKSFRNKELCVMQNKQTKQKPKIETTFFYTI